MPDNNKELQSVSVANTAEIFYLRYPWLIVALVLVVVGAAVYFTQYFRFDASSETLVVEGDEDLRAYEEISVTFGGDDFLFLTFAPASGNPITHEALATLDELANEIAAVEGVASVFSVLDAPLIESTDLSVSALEDSIPTLRESGIDLERARAELMNSPYFSELLITKHGDATALRIDLEKHQALMDAARQRERARAGQDTLSVERADEQYRVVRERYLMEREQLIRGLRQVAASFDDRGTLYLGGVPMIAADMISYVKSDLTVFGGAVIGLMIAAMGLFFRRLRWVVLPILTAVCAVVLTLGLLGYLDWQATVISSNFIALLAIITISLTIHLIVQYREFLHTEPDLTAKDLVHATLRAKFAPCFFTALTTVAAFSSLTVSGIVPVEDFGWMMCIGICISLAVTFSLFPAVLLLLPKGEASASATDLSHFIRAFGEFARWRTHLVVGLGVLIAIGAYFGVQRVSLDNRFAEYFDEETEIYQGMHYIDQNLGGTIPFDVVLTFPPFEEDFVESEGEDDFGFDDFGGEEELYPERYWFTPEMLSRLADVHAYVASHEHVGKVLSLATLEDVAARFTDGERLSKLEIAAILGKLPPELREELIQPYASPQTGRLRISARVIEAAEDFDRETFRQRIVEYAAKSADFAEDEVAVTGMMVLFNGMLKQMLSSQVNTLIYVIAAVFIMFIVLLRSVVYALLGLVPNVLAAASVIAAMGYFGIPLDMMTTTIAAICIGIGVDDTIHYLHRFREEFRVRGQARVAVSFSHASIGHALYFTSLTIIIGFSVLVFSNFVPTVMFGIWTAVAMFLALLANLTLLPALLVLVFGQSAPEPELRKDIVTGEDRDN